MKRCLPLLVRLLVLMSLPVAVQAANAPPLLPRTAEAPAIDGDLADPCWAKALLLADFTQPQVATAPAQKIEARLCFDDTALYIAMTCFESAPAKIRADKKADRGDVWMDDCVEIWLRAVGDASEFDQFIINTLSVQQTVRKHPAAANGPAVPGNPTTPANAPGAAGFKTTWKAQARVLADRWVCEIAIPFDNLGLKSAPPPGEYLEMKLGREDHAGGAIKMGGADTALSTWPPRSRYANSEDFAPVYIETTNLIRNPTLTAVTPGKGPTHWERPQAAADAELFTAAKEGDEAVIAVQVPGHYVTLSQGLKLQPGQLYRLSCETKGSGGAYLRARVKVDANEKNSRPFTVDLAPSAEWTARQLLVPGGLDGECLLILGCTDNAAPGALRIRHLALTRESAPPYQGPAIPVPVDAAEPFVIEALRPTDCRNLRGFIGAPIDGTVNSMGWNAEFWEYNRPGAGQGVGYFYRNSDGLHITFADAKGIQAVQIHGGVKARLVAGCTQYDDPASGKPVATFPGHTEHTLAYFEKPVVTNKLSFFEVSDGYIADVNFFRAGSHAPAVAAVGSREPLALVPALKLPAVLQPWLAKRFPAGNQTAFTLVDLRNANGLPAAVDLALTPGDAVHLLIGPLQKELPLSALGLTGLLKECPPGALLQVQLQDPLAPRTALTTALVALAGPGKVDLVLDFPDQLIPADRLLWVTLSAPAGKLTLSQSGMALYTVPREKALPESLAFRLTKLKGFYAAMSEARPWNGLHKNVADMEAWIDGTRSYAVQVREIRDAIDYCHALDANNATATAYYEWFHRGKLKPPLPAAILPNTPETKDAPEWAVAARAAWLTAREVPAWWLEHRAVPTGELGGQVGDDTDQFGNYADFPMFERDDIGGDLLACGERLAETAEQDNLEKGLNKITMDPLHAYEEGVNHEAQMVWWHYGDPVYFERCMVAAKSLESLTTVNAAGHRHFKNQDCGAQDLTFDRALGVDGFAHNQMLHPLFEVLWYNRNPRSMKLAREWGDAWLAHQKPGAFAGEVDVATDQPVASSLSTEPFASGYGGQQSAFLFLYQVTGEAKYLAPLRKYLAGAENLGNWPRCLPELQQLGFLDTLPDARPNLQRFSPALTYIVSGDKKPLIEALKKDVAEIQHFRHMYTTAEPFTDRVFLYAISNAAVAYTGGFATRNKFNHTHAVSYEGFGTNYAALVRTARKDRLELMLYNFKDTPITGQMRVWTLEHGTYEITQGLDDPTADRAGEPPAPTVKTQELWRHAPVALTLPPRRVVWLTVVQKTKLDPIEDRADLALSPREIKIAADGTITGVAHNIGARNVSQVFAAVCNAAGVEQARVAIGNLPAPLDLTPTRVPFSITLPAPLPGNHAGWTVRLFEDHPLKDRASEPEIDIENNKVPLP